MSFEAGRPRLEFLTPHLVSCVTLGNLFNLFKTQFIHPYYNISYSVVGALNEKYIKMLSILFST